MTNAMTHETSLGDVTQRRYETQARLAIRRFKQQQINARFVPTGKDAVEAVLGLIPADWTVGRGDSVTLDQIGLFDALRRRAPEKVLDPFERNAEGHLVTGPEEHLALEMQALVADAFVTSANAITQDGKIICTDSHGNRLAPMLFGPRRVVVVVGGNKMVRTLDEALARIRTVAAPMNATRHVVKHGSKHFAELPCTLTGTCTQCTRPQRICRKTIIIESERPSEGDRMNVIIVGEVLGL